MRTYFPENSGLWIVVCGVSITGYKISINTSLIDALRDAYVRSHQTKSLGDAPSRILQAGGGVDLDARAIMFWWRRLGWKK